MKALSFTISNRSNFLSFLIVLYFALSSADVLYVWLAIFRVKLTLLVSFFLFCFFFLQNRVHVESKILMAGSLLFLSMVISSLFSPHLLRSFGYSLVFLVEFFLYFLLSYHLIYQLDEKHIFKLYLISFCLVGAHAFSQLFFSFFGIQIPYVGQTLDLEGISDIVRPGAFTHEPSYYALYMTAFSAFWNSMYLFSHSFSRKKVFRNMLLGNALCLISVSTGVFFGLIFFFLTAIFLFYVIRKRVYILDFYRKIRITLSGFLSLFIVLFFSFRRLITYYFLKFFYYSGWSHYSFDIRWQGIKCSWEVFKKNPLFGVGNGGIGPYIFNDLYAIRDINLASFDSFQILDPTNVFMEALTSQGLFGLGCFLFLFYIFIDAFRKVLRLPSEYQAEKEIATSLFLSLIVLVLVLQFNQGLFRNYIWIHAGITIAYFHKLHDKSSLEIGKRRLFKETC